MEFIRVETLAQVEEAVKQIPEVVAIDTEFVKGNPRITELLAIIIAGSERAWYFPYDKVNMSRNCQVKLLIESRKVIFLQDYNHCDTIILYKHGIDIRDKVCYNLIDMHHLINENADHSLDARIREVYNDNYKKEFWSQFKSFEDAPEDRAIEYACKDAIYTYRLGMSDYKLVNKELLQHVQKLSRALLDTELNGIKVNVELIKKTKDETETKIKSYLISLREAFKEYCELWEFQEWQKEISKRTSEYGKLRVQRPIFNFESGPQLAWLLYEALKLEIINKTPNGNPKVDEKTLQALSERSPSIKPIYEFKRIKSLYGTFIKGMLERIENDRIYPHFNVSGTTTGRLSHSDPNMGNLPRTGTTRNFFVPDSGMCIIGADYSQLEVLIEANLTDDPNLLRIIQNGESKHDITAKGLGIDRHSAKTLNFALQYGAGAGKVGRILGVSLQDAEDVYKRYWELYSGVRVLKEKVNREIEEKGQVINLAGRIRRFPKAKNKYELFRQQRQGYNFLIQGLAAECCNRAFYRFAEISNKIGAKVLFSVHDEIVAQVRFDEQNRYVDNAKGWLMQIMEDVNKDFNFKYPLKAVVYGPLLAWGKE